MLNTFLSKFVFLGVVVSSFAGADCFVKDTDLSQLTMSDAASVDYKGCSKDELEACRKLFAKKLTDMQKKYWEARADNQALHGGEVEAIYVSRVASLKFLISLIDAQPGAPKATGSATPAPLKQDDKEYSKPIKSQSGA